MTTRTTASSSALVCLAASVTAILAVSDAPAQERARRPAPTHGDVSYGPHERNVIDFYSAESKEATPVLVFFHGGGFMGGDKRGFNVRIYRLCVENGIAFAAANYRLSQHAPYPAQMHDSARALQFLRSKAKEWNIDPGRIAAFGGSAGAGISLWLAFHDDLKDPESSDPVARESTRLACAIGLGAQCTYDPREIKEIVPGPAYEHAALRQLFAVPADFDWDSDEIDEKLAAKLRDASPIEHLSKDDAPVFVFHNTAQDKPGDIHHGNFGRVLKKKMDALGVECVRRMTDDFENARVRDEAIVEFVRGHVGMRAEGLNPQREE